MRHLPSTCVSADDGGTNGNASCGRSTMAYGAWAVPPSAGQGLGGSLAPRRPRAGCGAAYPTSSSTCRKATTGPSGLPARGVRAPTRRAHRPKSSISVAPRERASRPPLAVAAVVPAGLRRPLLQRVRAGRRRSDQLTPSIELVDQTTWVQSGDRFEVMPLVAGPGAALHLAARPPRSTGRLEDSLVGDLEVSRRSCGSSGGLECQGPISDCSGETTNGLGGQRVSYRGAWSTPREPPGHARWSRT